MNEKKIHGFDHFYIDFNFHNPLLSETGYVKICNKHSIGRVMNEKDKDFLKKKIQI